MKKVLILLIACMSMIVNAMDINKNNIKYKIDNIKYINHTEGTDESGRFGPINFYKGDFIKFENSIEKEIIKDVMFYIRNEKQVGHSDGHDLNGNFTGTDIYEGKLYVTQQESKSKKILLNDFIMIQYGMNSHGENQRFSFMISMK